MLPPNITEGSLVVALDYAAVAIVKRIADNRGWKMQVLSATELTLPALFAAADPSALVVIKTDAETPEDRLVRLIPLADLAVRGYCLDVVGGHP
jgi:hypothetical protein